MISTSVCRRHIARGFGMTLALSLACHSVSVARAESRSIRLDLAAPALAQPVVPGESLVLVVTNRLPDATYKYSVEDTWIPISTLEASSFVKKMAASFSLPADCQKVLDDFQKAVAAAKSETAVAAAAAAAQAKSRVVQQSCPSAVELYVFGMTTMGLETVAEPLRRGQQREIKVRRTKDGGFEEKEWDFVLTTGPRGEWRLSYGFTFFPNDDEEFFSEAVSGTSLFTIEKEHDRNSLAFAPSILYSWLSAAQRARDWAWSPVFGLGFDLDNPILFGGAGVAFNENILVTAGAVIHKTRRLNGRYEEGQQVAENLGDDQLEKESYRPGIYFGVGFRFDSSPFKAADDK